MPARFRVKRFSRLRRLTYQQYLAQGGAPVSLTSEREILVKLQQPVTWEQYPLWRLFEACPRAEGEVANYVSLVRAMDEFRDDIEEVS